MDYCLYSDAKTNIEEKNSLEYVAPLEIQILWRTGIWMFFVLSCEHRKNPPRVNEFGDFFSHDSKFRAKG